MFEAEADTKFLELVLGRLTAEEEYKILVGVGAGLKLSAELFGFVCETSDSANGVIFGPR